MGFEPTTSCLEGRNSTAELHPHDRPGTPRPIGSVPHSEFRVPRCIRVGGEGFEPPKALSRQIYSLMQLSTLPSAHGPRATGGNRTHNLRFTKPLHYRCATVANLREPITIRPPAKPDKAGNPAPSGFYAGGRTGSRERVSGREVQPGGPGIKASNCS